MNRKIQAESTRLKWCFAAFWLLAAAGVAAGESHLLDTILTDPPGYRSIYFAETFTILATAICVPLALKLFAWVQRKRIDTAANTPCALRRYVRWSVVRLLILAVPLVMGLVVYYLMLSSTGALCACIALLASLFCLPSETRMRQSLKIDAPTGAE